MSPTCYSNNTLLICRHEFFLGCSQYQVKTDGLALRTLATFVTEHTQLSDSSSLSACKHCYHNEFVIALFRGFWVEGEIKDC